MRIVYIDIDSLRPDHLSCYGYQRRTSPHIDRIAGQGVRFTNCYVSDAPCLPSRTSLFSGRFGIHTGVVNHGGTASQPFIEPERGFVSNLHHTCWMTCLRRAGMRTVAVSPFGERHSAWHWYAGFSEVHNTAKMGSETADEIAPVALHWIEQHGRADDWFMHVNFWDPHKPYRTPESFGEPFRDDPTPAWLTEAVRREHWQGCGSHGAREAFGFLGELTPRLATFPRQPGALHDMTQVRRVFDGYDTAVRYVDEHVGRIVAALERQGVLDDTAIIISADHGENLGELNIYGDHQTADQITCRVPMIVRWPGVTDGQAGRSDDGLYYQNDVAAMVVELLGERVPENWDGRSFAGAFKRGEPAGRDHLVLSQCATCCQRAVRFSAVGNAYICIRTWHDGFNNFPQVMLFDINRDPHEQHDLAKQSPQLVDAALRILEQWVRQMLGTSAHGDPLETALRESPLHAAGELPAYLERLRRTERSGLADQLEVQHRPAMEAPA